MEKLGGGGGGFLCPLLERSDVKPGRDSGLGRPGWRRTTHEKEAAQCQGDKGHQRELESSGVELRGDAGQRPGPCSLRRSTLPAVGRTRT